MYTPEEFNTNIAPKLNRYLKNQLGVDVNLSCNNNHILEDSNNNVKKKFTNSKILRHVFNNAYIWAVCGMEFDDYIYVNIYAGFKFTGGGFNSLHLMQLKAYKNGKIKKV